MKKTAAPREYSLRSKTPAGAGDTGSFSPNTDAGTTTGDDSGMTVCMYIMLCTHVVRVCWCLCTGGVGGWVGGEVWVEAIGVFFFPVFDDHGLDLDLFVCRKEKMSGFFFRK